MQEAVIIDGLRSPMGKVKNGKLLDVRPDELGGQVLDGLLKRNPNYNPSLVEDVAVGCAFPEGAQGFNIARGISVLGGVPETAGAATVNRFCGSSMQTVHQLAMAIQTGNGENAVAGGIEHMFQVPMGGYNPSFHPGLNNMDYYIGMGQTAENLAQKGSISREAQEKFAMDSHEKALKAQAENWLENEIHPITLADGSTATTDEYPRTPNAEKIASLRPAFDTNGTITAATSSPITIGAAFLLLSSASAAEKQGLKPRAKIRSMAVAGCNWKTMGEGPLPASKKALERAGISINDIDAIELNEAFAAQSLYVLNTGEWPIEKTNLNGGAIALGHPLGCSGARLIVTLLNVLDRIDGKYGLATMCIGGGQGISTVIERL